MIINKNLNNIQNELQNFIQNEASKYNVTGISFVMECPNYQNGIPVTFHAGLQKKNGTPVTDHSLYQIGSNSKVFLAIVMLQLETEGKLSLENKLSYFFPDDFPKWQDISIKQLLNMTSHIPCFTDDEDIRFMKTMINNPKYNFTSEEILNTVKDKELLEIEWYYSNSNYVLAAKIIEFVTKNKLSKEIKNRVIKPLYLNHTYYIDSLPKLDVDLHDLENLMSGYLVVLNR